MKHVELVQEGCSDILADAKRINEKRRIEEEAEFIEDNAEAIETVKGSVRELDFRSCMRLPAGYAFGQIPAS